jgi:hypothetical protein
MAAFLLFAGLGALYALTYYLNQSTAQPAGCEDIDVQCTTCSSSTCAVKPLYVKEKQA